nr:unnamed protein product [Naegleria fowleri]
MHIRHHCTHHTGALVLADGGVCCIDEFDSIRDHDRATIHEAMEQQTLSIAKAGLVCKLNTRTTVLAACNPKGKYDLGASLSVNCALASPLLSRFDIVLVLLDTQDEEWDYRVSSFILNEQEMEEEDSQLWSFDKLRAYISFVKSEYHPQLTPESGRILTEYYRLQRRADRRVAARTTIRLLESLVRLAQAHARLMCRHEVTLQDAIMSVLTVDISSNTSSLLNVESVLHSNFPLDPDEDYSNYIQLVLYKLGIQQELPNVPSSTTTTRKRHSSKRLSDGGDDVGNNDSGIHDGDRNSLQKQQLVDTTTEDDPQYTRTRELLIDDDDDNEENVFNFQEDDTTMNDLEDTCHSKVMRRTSLQTKRKLEQMKEMNSTNNSQFTMSTTPTEENDYQPKKKKSLIITSEELDNAEKDIQKTPSLSNTTIESNFRRHLEQRQGVMRRLEFNNSDTLLIDTSDDHDQKEQIERLNNENTARQLPGQHSTTAMPQLLQVQQHQPSALNSKTLLPQVQQAPPKQTQSMEVVGTRASKSLLPTSTNSNNQTTTTTSATTNTTTNTETNLTTTTATNATSTTTNKRRGFLSTLLSKGAPSTTNNSVTNDRNSKDVPSKSTTVITADSRHQYDQNIEETSFEFPSLLLGVDDDGLLLGSTPEKPHHHQQQHLSKAAGKRLLEDNDDELDSMI